ncbi:urease subunit beta [Candidatus Shikimatogenerans silvanidophilus]|uniref:urease subunit beta n=1 Tax=Candidatus Shikimatogenerans silvanidophilus TaxID=2782547 RepID=UPI002A4E1F02|nr:urease subunit beta [Candidatus Shikimatogenerans silvanidophilus]
MPGEYKLKKNNIYFFSERKKIFRKIFNSGDRVIQIGSHFNFYKVNKFLKFNRKGTKGYKLNIPSGTCIRIYPKKNKIVELVEIGGEKKIYGY